MQRHYLLALTGLLLASTAVGQTSTVSVQGGVNRPGVYSVDPAGVTLSTAIREAGGLIGFASNRAVIYRADDHGIPHEIPVMMLQRILDHKAEDVALKPGDVVYVPAPGTKPDRPPRPVKGSEPLAGVDPSFDRSMILFHDVCSSKDRYDTDTDDPVCPPASVPPQPWDRTGCRPR